MSNNPLSITNIPRISAIYFALLQNGYDFFIMGRDSTFIHALQPFIQSDAPLPFFAQARQSSCEVYPYWPRVALLEEACFFLNDDASAYQSFDSYKHCVENASNLSTNDLSPALWQWLSDFPSALKKLLHSPAFLRYLEWENAWISQQNAVHQQELAHIQHCLDLCTTQYGVTFPAIKICLCPIKCIHSSDYHTTPDHSFICTLGALDCESVLHEFMHTVLHPYLIPLKQQITQKTHTYPQLDHSYYLDGSEEGKLNAFEEYAVRQLTATVSQGHTPHSLPIFLQDLLSTGVDIK